MGGGQGAGQGDSTVVAESMTGALNGKIQQPPISLSCTPIIGAVKTGPNDIPKTRRFACPFFKNDQRTFIQWRACIGPGFQTIHRLKEHLYRKHSPPANLCSRCLVSYKTAAALLEHQRSPEACRVKSERRDAGTMTAEQRSKLRTKKKYVSVMTEEEKWVAMYRILFPGVAIARIPSPYYLDDDESRDAPESCKSNSQIISQQYEQFIENGPPPELVEEYKKGFRHAISSADDTKDLVQKMTDVAWKLQISTWRHYIQVSNL